MSKEISSQVATLLSAYNLVAPQPTADSLRDLWFQFEPKSTGFVKAEQLAQQETIGTPVAVLKSIGQEIGKVARQRVDDFISLAQLLWAEYGREGRIVAVHILGPMELATPDKIMPLVMELCRTCISWEDADQLAMNALEPIVRKKPAQWLSAMEPWLADNNKWVRRAGVTVIGRLPMKHTDYTARCLTLTERLLLDEEQDVKRAVSFAIRIATRGDIAPVREFLARHIPPENPAATWVLCDTIRSMTKQFLPQFASLLPRYQQWAADPTLSGQDRRSVESAVKILQEVQR
ncbi:MAG: DNA alkylation repair protein [Anaerolineae bacterium]|nr:DNA alkylation repair protein [Anaerolineae bacterium]